MIDQVSVMLHTNVAELRLLFNTFTRVWSSGGQANLSLQTKDNQTWAKLDLQLGPADGRRPGPPEAGGRAGAQPPQVRRKGQAARARDARRRQEWQARRKEPALELPVSQNQEPRTQPESDPEQQSQEILLAAEAVHSTVIEETIDEIIDINTDMIPQLDGPAETSNDTPVTLEFDADGYIVGPKLAKNSAPPARVFHPKCGIGTLHGESLKTKGQDSFFHIPLS